MNPALAATAKMLKTVTALRLGSRKTFAFASADATWLAKSKLTPTDRKQLVAILASYETKPPITLERALATPPDALFVDALHAFGESPVEWFDVFDQDGVVQFQLWLYHADRGLLLKAATTTAVAPIVASSFRGRDRGLDEPTAERLAALLRKAKKPAAALHPASALARADF